MHYPRGSLDLPQSALITGGSVVIEKGVRPNSGGLFEHEEPIRLSAPENVVRTLEKEP